MVELAGGRAFELKRGQGEIIWLGRKRRVEVLVPSRGALLQTIVPEAALVAWEGVAHRVAFRTNFLTTRLTAWNTPSFRDFRHRPHRE